MNSAVVKADPDSSQEATTQVVRLEDAAKCRGIDLLWSMLSAVAVERARPIAAIADPPLLLRLILSDELSISIDDCPEPPVP